MIEVNPNYMQQRQGFNEMKNQVALGNRILQKSKRGISVMENKFISESLKRQTQAPILTNEFMKNQIEKVMQVTEKSGLFETIKRRSSNAGEAMSDEPFESDAGGEPHA